MYYLLYNTLLSLLKPAYHVGARLHPRLREFRASRRSGRDALYRFLLDTGGENTIWLHAASVGEFDQALALSREIKKRDSGGDRAYPLRIIISVFSLSVKKTEHDEVDLVFYLPLDFKENWEDVLLRFRPRYFATMTWDVWPNLLRALGRRGIPAYLCSAALAADSSRLRFPWLQLLPSVYENFTGIGAVNEANQDLFGQLLPDPARIKVTGDTRIDTIVYKIQRTHLDPIVEETLGRLKGDSPLLVLASTYDADDKEVLPVVADLMERFPDWRALIFPHHTNEERLHEVELNASTAGLPVVRYSSAVRREETNARVLLVDRMGILALAYRFGEFCYVGGGYHHRIHNTAEPAALGLPVITGPRIDTSPIALDLEAAGALKRTRDQEQLRSTAETLMSSPQIRRAAGRTAEETVRSSSGAAKRFYDAFLS